MNTIVDLKRNQCFGVCESQGKSEISGLFFVLMTLSTNGMQMTS